MLGWPAAWYYSQAAWFTLGAQQIALFKIILEFFLGQNQINLSRIRHHIAVWKVVDQRPSGSMTTPKH